MRTSLALLEALQEDSESAAALALYLEQTVNEVDLTKLPEAARYSSAELLFKSARIIREEQMALDGALADFSSRFVRDASGMRQIQD